MQKLKRNAIKCLDCEVVIESTYRHDYRTCGCPNRAMVDGGLDYQRYGAMNLNKIEDLSEFEDDNADQEARD